MECIGPLLDIGNKMWNPISKRWEYHRSLEENMRILNKKLEELNSRKSDKQLQIDEGLRSGKILKNEIRLWLQNVEEINNEKLTLEQEVGKHEYLSRARLGKLADKKIQEVEKLHEKGSFPDGLMLDAAAPERGESFPTTSVFGESTAEKKMEEIWTSLINDDDVRKIGLYGMGGSGKTTITKHIHNRVLEKKDRFDNVFWITVSKAKDIITLQSDIARELKVDISGHPDEAMRARMLYNELKTKRRYVLIFDDMWEAFNLEDVGIPEPTTENGCKLLLTTRLLEVCRKWSCKCIKMELFSEEEAWNLFMEKVGPDVVLTSSLEETVKLVAKECARLPLAIVTIGTSMKGVTDEREWKNALKELRDSTTKGGLNEMDKVIERIKYSYSQLKDERLQQCLLFCGLYPEDYVIRKEELIVYLIYEKIIKGAGSRKEQFNEGHTILNKLVNACLLEKCTNFLGLQCVKMHDVVRDMVLQIMGRGSIVKAGVQLSDFPDNEIWTEDLERVSLMDNYMEEIPPDASPRCSRLKTLLLLHNGNLRTILDPFFENMSGLQVLDISHTGIEILPDSVSALRNLTALIARECEDLRYVPSLAALLALETLDLENTAIEEVPQGIEMLINLRHLAIISDHLKSFPTGILPKLSHLQRLIIQWGLENLKLKGDEVTALSKLEFFGCQFIDIDDFNRFMQLQQWRLPLPYSYYLKVGPIEGLFLINEWVEQLNAVKYVELRKCNIGESKDPLMLPNDIENLIIRECNDMSSLSDILSFNNEEGGVPSPPLPPGTFSSLKALGICDCGKIKRLFTPGLVPYLQNLEVLVVHYCSTMEVIIGAAAEEEEERGRGEGSNNQSVVKNDDIITICLPKLRLLDLSDLPNLKSIICKRGLLACDAIETIEVYCCWNLKRLPISLPVRNGQPSPPPSLTQIRTDRAWWDSLEWDNPIVKDVLQSFVFPA